MLLCIAALCRATFYGTDEKVEAAHVACGEPAGQYGIIAQGSCGYTNSDGSLPFPREMYAANADTNVDYPGSCGRCYEVRDNTFAVCVGDMQLYATTGTGHLAAECIAETVGPHAAWSMHLCTASHAGCMWLCHEEFHAEFLPVHVALEPPGLPLSNGLREERPGMQQRALHHFH